MNRINNEHKHRVNNDSQLLGPILGKLVEPLYQQGANPTGPQIKIVPLFSSIHIE
jgi:hypothetical protein